jgi:hypothetical protein
VGSLDPLPGKNDAGHEGRVNRGIDAIEASSAAAGRVNASPQATATSRIP